MESTKDSTGQCPNCGRRQGWDGHAYGPCGREVGPKVYPTREDYAREVWASLDDDDRADTLWQYDMTEANDEFIGYFADNMDAMNNGTVHFTPVDGGFTVVDEAVEGGE